MGMNVNFKGRSNFMAFRVRFETVRKIGAAWLI